MLYVLYVLVVMSLQGCAAWLPVAASRPAPHPRAETQREKREARVRGDNYTLGGNILYEFDRTEQCNARLFELFEKRREETESQGILE